MKITHASTFSGIGAPEVAAEMLGWDNVFHCEINPFGRAVLDYYFPNSKSYEDITQTDFSEWRGKVTVLTGGFPCQPFSYAGKRRGSEDDRYLWPYMLRCIEQVQPTWFIGENVAGIATMVFPGRDVQVGSTANLFGEGDALVDTHERYVLDEICEGLERAGYSVQPLLIPACAVEAPHRRDRIWIIAHRDAADTEDLQLNGRVAGERCHGESSVPQSGDGDCTKAKTGEHPTSYTPSQRRREIYQSLQPQLADGAEPIGDGGQRTTTEATSENTMHGRQLYGCDAESRSERDIRDAGARSDERIRSRASWLTDASELYPENRWRAFPTQSPVYRGNDGLPFNVDDLTIPFGEWKRESLKAYGNAWCVQVGYELMRAIDTIEQLQTQ